MYTTWLYHNWVKYEWGKAPQPITESWIYWSASLWLISLSSNWTDWITIADKNLGATEVYSKGSSPTEANSWYLYQRWNNHWFPWADKWTPWTSSSKVNVSSYWPWNYYSGASFITVESSPYDWFTSLNSNLWWWTTWTNEAMQWPCDTWFHVPSTADWQNIIWIWVSLWICTTSYWGDEKFIEFLKLSLAGSRTAKKATISWVNTNWYYWSANTDKYLILYPSEVTLTTASWFATWQSIRPFANIPVQPTEERTKLF